MAGGKGRLLEGLGLHVAPEREEVPRASPWRRQHARASPVPATTPLFSRVVTSASGKMRMWASRGGKAQCREHQTVRGSSKGQRKRDARAWDGKREMRGGGSAGGHSGVRGVLHQLFLDPSWRALPGVPSLLWVPTASEQRPHRLSFSSPSASEAKTGRKGRRGVRLSGVARRNRCSQVFWRGREAGCRRRASQNGLSS